MVPALTDAERKELGELESVIKDGLQSFIEVGAALLKIRDNKLYRETHRTFEAYCGDKFKMTIRHAQRLMLSFQTVEEIRPMGRLPGSERQIRPLTHLKPEQQREVWKEAVDTAKEGKVTGKHVEKTVEKMIPSQTKQKRGQAQWHYADGDGMDLIDLKEKIIRGWNCLKERDKRKFVSWLKHQLKDDGELGKFILLNSKKKGGEPPFLPQVKGR